MGPIESVKKKIHIPEFLKKKRVLAIILAALIVFATVFSINWFKSSTPDAEYTEYTVERGDIVQTITGTGSIEPIDQYEITALVKGEVLESAFEEGSVVNKGDTLYVIDASDAQTNLDKSELSLKKQQMSYDQSVESEKNLKVKTDSSGIISNIYVEVGDSVQSGSKIADVYDKNNLILRVPFNYGDIPNIRLGQTAEIVLESTFEKIYGTVTYISKNEYSTQGGMTVADVEISVKNPGSVTDEVYATALVNNIACNSGAKFSYATKKTITAKTSGDVTKIYYNEGDYVSSGSVLAELDNDNLSIQTENSLLSLKDAELSLNNMYDQLDDYVITAPITGTVIEKTTKAGDTIDATSSKTVMATIADMSKLTFSIAIDELDISKVSLGQEVTVNADALSNKTFKGTVSNISIIGTSSSGVTTYPIDVVIEDGSGLLPGMNVDATITVKESKDTLIVPVSAVVRGNKILVAEKDIVTDEDSTKTSAQTSGNESAPVGAVDAQSAQSKSKADTAQNQKTSASRKKSGVNGQKNVKNSNIPDGYKYVNVTLGINDSSFIEVTSGLKEGAKILVPVVKATQSTQQTVSQMKMGMGGGVPSEMPSGGTRSTYSGSGGYQSSNRGN